VKGPHSRAKHSVGAVNYRRRVWLVTIDLEVAFTVRNASAAT